jgi:hypothetical protein
MVATPQLQFFTDPAEFLSVAGDHLAAEPVINTVVTSVAHRTIARLAEGTPQPDGDWWLAVRDDGGAVVGAGMRTAPFEPRPLFLLPMPDEAAVALAATLVDRGEEVLGVNGALPAVEVCASEIARINGGRVEVSLHTRLHELGELVPPKPVPGQLVAAAEDDIDLVLEWFTAFADDADEQAGRPRGSALHDVPDPTALLHRIRRREMWFWVDAGRPVHLTAVSPPSFGVARVGPVYTPRDQRGRGWASNAVAAASRMIQAQGARACLFTDQANPTSNKIYAALGYRPVVDMANLAIVP